MTFSKGNVIPSQCAHWRGNPLNRRGLPRRFAPRNDKYNLPRCVILSEAAIGREVEESVFFFEDLRILKFRCASLRMTMGVRWFLL